MMGFAAQSRFRRFPNTMTTRTHSCFEHPVSSSIVRHTATHHGIHPTRRTSSSCRRRRHHPAVLFALDDASQAVEVLAAAGGNVAAEMDSYGVAPPSSYSSGITQPQTFEPIVNVPALTSFVLIAIVFTLLQLRINAVSTASIRRTEALANLRKVKSLQLSGGGGVGSSASDAADAASSSSSATATPDRDEVARAVAEYDAALREELELRTILPGVRLVAPNDPKRQEEEVAAAKLFLGLDLTDDDDGDGGGKDNVGLSTARGERGLASSNNGDSDESAGLSNGAKAVLALVGALLTALLFVLSLDAVVGDKVFTMLGGEPPNDMPLSSW